MKKGKSIMLIVMMLFLILLSFNVLATDTLIERYAVQDADWNMDTQYYASMSFLSKEQINLTIAGVYIRKQGTTGGFTAWLYTASPEGKPNTPLIYLDHIEDSEITTSYKWFNLSSGNTTLLEQNLNYSIVVFAPVPRDGANRIKWGLDTGGGYTNGTLASGISNSSWTVDSYDVDFEIYGRKQVNNSGVVTLISPTDDSIWNQTLLNLTYNLNITAATSEDVVFDNCSLYTNESGNWIVEDTDYNVNSNGINYFNRTFNSGNYLWNVLCFTNISTNYSNYANYSFIVDITKPKINPISGDVFTNFFMVANENLNGVNNISGTINFTDDNLFQINISTDIEQIFYITNLSSINNYQYNLSHYVANYSVGRHNLTLEAWDGHTKNLIKSWKVKKPIFGIDNYVMYSWGGWFGFDDDWIKIDPKGLKGNIKTKKEIDRYTWEFEKSNNYKSISFEVTSSKPITIVKGSHYPGHLIVMGIEKGKWIDFKLKDSNGQEIYDVEKINDYKVIVTINNMKNKKIHKFRSIGDLNYNSQTYNFYVINATESYSSDIFSGFNNNLFLNVSFGELNWTPNETEVEAIVEFNNTNYTSNIVSLDVYHALFNNTINLPLNQIGSSIPTNVSHKWYFSIKNSTPENYTTFNKNQTQYDITIDSCNETVAYPIINFSYYDDVSNNLTNLTNVYNLKFYDGTYNYTANDVFPRNTTNKLCTNIPSNTTTYNWNWWGTLTLSEPNYVTRVYNIEESVPESASNNPPKDKSLFLIKTADSSTISYTWLTTLFQTVDGTMRIFRCNDDSTQDLIESIPIINGQASANIELLTQLYSYDIIIDGVIYSDTNSYSQCHIESSNAATYYVEINEININDLIGLESIQCELTKGTGFEVTFNWGANNQNNDPVEGCIDTYQSGIFGNELISENCSNQSNGFSYTIDLSDNGVTNQSNYYVLSKVHQGNYEIFCGNQLNYKGVNDFNGGKEFGVAGLLASFLLVAAIALLYAGEGPLQLFGAGLALVGMFLLGITNFSWPTISLFLAFLGIIYSVGRYSRKN